MESFSEEDPSWQAKVEAEIARLEGAMHCLSLNSGVSAVSCLLGTLETGATVVVPSDFYSGTRYLMNKCFGSRFKYVELKPNSYLEGLELALATNQVQLVLLETPTNPLLHVFDIKACSDLIQRHRKDSLYPILVVDSTFCTPVFQNPLKNGADVVLHSATKFLGGHSDALAGALCTNNDTLNEKL